MIAFVVSRMRRKIIGRRPRNSADADNGEIVDRKRARDPGRRHGAAADAGEVERVPVSRERARRAPPRAHRRIPPPRRSRSTTGAAAASRSCGLFLGHADEENLRQSAAAVSRAGSATIVAPAVTASPARPARATFSTVCGPMAGRSKRRSWLGFGALTRTPTPAGVVARPCPRKSAMRASRLSVPSAASTPSTWPLATTTAWPTSNGPSAEITASARAISASILRRRLVTAHDAFGRDYFRRHVAHTDDANTVFLKQARQPRQEPVVAAAEEADHPRHQPDRQPVQADLRERRPQHGADEQSLAAVFGPGETKEASGLPYRDPMVRVALDHFWVGPAAHRKHHRPSAALDDCLGDRAGKLPPPQITATDAAPPATTALPGASRGIVIIVWRRHAPHADASKAACRQRG